MSRFHSLEIVDRRQETADSVSLAFAVPADLAGGLRVSARPVPDRPRHASTARSAGAPIRSARARTRANCASRSRGSKAAAFRASPMKRSRPARASRSLPPEGRFTAEIGADRHYAFFAAGSGITPVMSIIRSTLAANARSPRDARLRQPHDREHHVPRGARRSQGPLSRTLRRLPRAVARVAGDRPAQRPDRRRAGRAAGENDRAADGCRRLLPVRAVRHDRGRPQGADRGGRRAVADQGRIVFGRRRAPAQRSRRRPRRIRARGRGACRLRARRANPSNRGRARLR